MTTQPIWQNLTPQYIANLSSSSLLARDEVFSTGDAHMFANNPQPPHWHDAYEIGFVVNGTGAIVMGQRAYAYVPGQVYVINDFDPHMGYPDPESSVLFVIHFHPSILEGGWIGQMRHEARAPFLPQFGIHGPLIPLDDPMTVPVRTILEHIREEVYQRQPLWDVIISGLLIQAIGLLARQTSRESSDYTPEEIRRRRALKSIQPILQLLQERFAEALSLDDMASAAGVSGSYCCDLFREALGTSPIAYRNALRLAEARRLMQTTRLTIRAIAYQVGFQSVQELNRLFRRESGCTPSQFLIEQRQ